MKAKLFNIFSVLMIVAMLAMPVSALAKAPEPDTEPQPAQTATLPWTDPAEKAVYIIRLADDPIATYDGDIAGFAATSPAVLGTQKVAQDAAVNAYLGYLQNVQAAFINEMESVIGHPADVKFTYQYAYNGMAVELTAAEALAISKMKGVVDVQRETIEHPLTDAGPEWIGAPGIWNGAATGGAGTMGEGVVVAILDTGINSDHPSFADIGGDGYDHTNPLGAGNYIPGSYCDTTPSFCNDKLIGAWSFVTEAVTPEDSGSHGSHTASTVAGNVVTSTIEAPTTAYTDTISGVAPHANIIAYDVCRDGGCPGAALLAAVNQVIADSAQLPHGIAVINYSISGGADPYNSPVEQAFLAANDAGIFVSASAGNSGPAAGTVAHLSPWVMTVGASTHNRAVENYLVNMSSDAGAGPADITGAGFTAGYGPAPIVYAGDFPNPNDPNGDPAQCLQPYPAGTWTHGEIVVCDRGAIARVAKGQNVLAGGAGGFVLANTDAQGESIVADGHFLPAVHIGDHDADILRAWLATHPTGAVATIAGTSFVYDDANGDIMADFSSRGPSGAFSVLKPDVTAPGVDIWAAYANGAAPNPPEYGFMSGTSMSSPHDAGAAALIKAVHPNWTPDMIKAALMTTSWTDVLKDDGVTPADPFDMGAGRIQVDVAAQAGLVMVETHDNYVAANPETGGDPKTLNIPSMTNDTCVGTCSWERTVLSTLAVPMDWQVILNAPPTLTLSASPMTFTINPGMTQTLVVTADVMGAPIDVWQFAEVVISPTTIVRAPQPAAPVAMEAAPNTAAATAPVAPLATIFGPEDFEGSLYPPTGWMTTTTGATDDPGWITTTLRAHSGNYSVYHNDDNTTGSAISWLVMPTVTLPAGASLVFWQNQHWDTYYAYHGIWVSTGDCDPANGAFAELTELGAGTENTWEEMRVDLSAYGGQDACIAFRYEGDYADEWYIDDVSVVTAEPNLSNSEKNAPVVAESGETITYTIVISNSGNLSATLATMTDALPAGVTYDGNLSCTSGSCNYDTPTNSVLWSGVVTNTESVTVEFTAELSGTCGSVITNTAVISDPLTAAPVTVNAVTEIYDAVYLNEDFEGGFPPAGWYITATHGTTMTWDRNDAFGVGNLTAYGSGYSAAAQAYGSGVAWNAELWSPPVTLGSDPNHAVELSFASNFQDYAGNGDAYLEISTDGGSTWTELFHKTTDDVSGGTLEQIDLAPYKGETITLRWLYTATNATAWFWHIDDVKIVGCDIPAPAYVPPAHMPVAVRPAGSSLPDAITIVTDQYSGTHTIDAVQVLSTVTDLSSVDFGMVRGDLYEDYINQDSTNGNPFDNLDEVMWFTVDVPSNTMRLVAEIIKTTAPDLDLFIGTGDTPSGATLVAYSATGTAMEYVNYDAPPAGTWWILVQNWEGSDEQPDRVLMTVGVVPDADSGNMTITGPASVPAGNPFDLDVNWDEPSMVGYDRWYGAFGIGTDAAHPDNLGIVNVDLHFLGAMVTKSAPEYAASGDTFTYEITLDTPGPISGTAVISDVLPSGVAFVTGTLTSTFGTAHYDAVANAVYWNKDAAMRGTPISLAADSLAPAAPDGVAVELVLDDGSNENNIGIGGSSEFIFANYFSPEANLFPLFLDEVQVYFEGGTTGVQAGDDIIIVFYKDDDGNPTNGADYIAGYPTTIQSVDAWNTYVLSTTVPFDAPTNIFIGVIAMETPGTSYFPAAIDADASQGRSWAGWWSTSPPPDPPTLPPNNTWGLIDAFGFPGNWLIRGYGESLVPDTINITFDVTVTGQPGDVITNTANLDYNGTPGAGAATTRIASRIYLPLVMK